MTAIEIGVLGELTVVRAGEPVAVAGSGRRALLALLVANVARVVPVEGIVDGLWGEDPPGSAVKVIQTHVSKLRRLLEPGAEDGWRLLVTHPSGYELAVPTGSVDAIRFEEAVRAASELAAVDAVGPLRDALAEWRGQPYAGIERPFAAVEAARLERLRVAALSRCLTGELACGRHRQVEPELRALVAEHPLDESLVGSLMLALYRSGRQAEALERFTRLQRALAEELGTDPGPAMTRLHERILRQDASLDLVSGSTRAVTVTRREADRGNLPSERSSFVGRHEQVRRIAGMVRRQRLTTLVGAGGAGKTRLALRSAAEAADAFDGAWLVALGPLVDPSDLDGHCLTELGVTDQMDRSPADTLRAWIGERRLLLVLDNCEHVVSGVAELTERLLASCPGLHVLATSRQPLHCADERQWRVPTLGLPESPDVSDVLASEAGKLFLERATAAQPEFELDGSTAPAVSQICRRLDGIPLAIELAAVRMATMSATDLAEGLDDRFRLLTSGNRAALPRHRTLLATTDWSYELLTADQQRLLCRLATFAAEFDVGAAVQVCGTAPLHPGDVPGLLADLVDQSLVEARQADGHTRYRLLETVREYGQQRLGAEADEVAYRYGEWVAELAESVAANAHLDTGTWYQRLDREFLHLQAAFAIALRRRDGATALRIAAGSGWALIIIGRFHRQREWLRQALALAESGDVDDRVMAQGLLMAGAVAGIDQRFDGTLDLLDQAETRFRAAGDLRGVLWVGYWRAATLAEMGDLGAALAQIEATVESAAERAEVIVEASARAEHAELLVAAALDDREFDRRLLDEAATVLARSQRLAEDQDMQELRARVGLGTHLLTALRGEPEAALSGAMAELDRWRELGRGNRLILGLVATAKVATWAGHPKQARCLVDEAVRLIGEFAWSAPLRGALEVLVLLEASSDPVTAATLLGAAGSRAPTHRWRMPAGLGQVPGELEQTLGTDRFAALVATGRDLGIDEIVALAREGGAVGGPPASRSGRADHAST